MRGWEYPMIVDRRCLVTKRQSGHTRAQSGTTCHNITCPMHVNSNVFPTWRPLLFVPSKLKVFQHFPHFPLHTRTTHKILSLFLLSCISSLQNIKIFFSFRLIRLVHLTCLLKQFFVCLKRNCVELTKYKTKVAIARGICE